MSLTKLQPSALLILFFFGSIGLIGQSKTYKNANPSEIQTMKYQWSEFAPEGEYTKRTKDELKWYSQYTTAKPGYIRLKDGSFEEGDLQVRFRYNQASEEKVRNSEGNKVPHPKGWKGIHEVTLTQDGEKKSYWLKDLMYYGYQFQASEWPASAISNPLLQFQDAELFFSDQTVLEGKVRLGKSKSSFGLNQYGTAYFDDTNAGYVRPYMASEMEGAIIQTAGGAVQLDIFENHLIEAPLYFKAFSNRYKEYKLDPAISAVLIDDNENKVKGTLFFDKGKKKKDAYFFNEDNSDLINLNKYSFSLLEAKIDGQDQKINYFEGRYMSMTEIKEKLNKKDLLLPGEVVLESGKKIKGEVYFLRMSNAVKSYRFIYGVSIIPEGKDYFRPFKNENIDYVKVTEEGKEATYIMVGQYYENQADFVENLKNSNSPDPFRNLQDGYLMFEGNKKLVGKIAAAPPSTIYFLGADGIPVRYKASSKELLYYVQTLKEKDYQFVGFRNRSSVTEIPFIFLKIEAPFSKYSYYKNPYPTHVRKGATKWGAGLANTISSEINEEMDYHGVERTASSIEVDTDQKSNTSPIANYKQHTIRSTQFVDADKNSGEGIFFDEYIVFQNDGETAHLIYQKNDEEVLKKLLSNCKDFQTLDEKKQIRLTKVEFISEAIRYLNSCE